MKSRGNSCPVRGAVGETDEITEENIEGAVFPEGCALFASVSVVRSYEGGRLHPGSGVCRKFRSCDERYGHRWVRSAGGFGCDPERVPDRDPP